MDIFLPLFMALILTGTICVESIRCYEGNCLGECKISSQILGDNQEQDCPDGVDYCFTQWNEGRYIGDPKASVVKSCGNYFGNPTIQDSRKVILSCQKEGYKQVSQLSPDCYIMAVGPGFIEWSYTVCICEGDLCNNLNQTPAYVQKEGQEEQTSP